MLVYDYCPLWTKPVRTNQLQPLQAGLEGFWVIWLLRSREDILAGLQRRRRDDPARFDSRSRIARRIVTLAR